MSFDNVPAELKTRRGKIISLYMEGFCVADIARYFEVSIDTILTSFDALGLSLHKNRICNHDLDIQKTGQQKSIDEVLQERDAFLHDLSEEDILALGFWKRPTEYRKVAQMQNAEMALQTELRTIGFRKEEIAVYMGYQSVDQVKAIRKNTDELYLAQQEVAFRLYSERQDKRQWSNKRIMEFCGVKSGHIIYNPTLEEKIKQRNEARIRKKELMDEQMQEIFSMYQEQKMTQQKIAEEMGISRRTVINYLQKYQEENGISSEEMKRHSMGRNEKYVSEEDVARMKDQYLTKNEEGKYVCKKGISYAYIAKELGFTEVTVVKYIGVINDQERERKRKETYYSRDDMVR